MTTTRSIRDELQNVLDYLMESELAAYTNPISVSPYRVTWNATVPSAPFMSRNLDSTLAGYRHWLSIGAYTAMLFDGSLLQVTIDVDDGAVSRHRLAYVPCPYRLDEELMRTEAVLDVVELHVASEPTNMLLKSVVRFDFDPSNAKVNHPASHLTINSSDCRIACAAPLHVGRFLDFVFRHFYRDLWRAHDTFFSELSQRTLGPSCLTEEDRALPHMNWNYA